MIFEIVTLGRRKGMPERNNARYQIIESDKKMPVGTKWEDGDYKIELIYIKKLSKNPLK